MVCVWLCRTFPNHDATYLLWLDARGLLPYLPKDTTPAAFFMDKVCHWQGDSRGMQGDC